MYRIGIDVGGTFTDCTILDDRGTRRIVVAKSPTTHGQLSEGIMSAIADGAETIGLTLEQLLADTDLIVHGSTVATNAVVEHRGADCALVTTRGHEDTLAVGRMSQKVAGLAPHEMIDERLQRKAGHPLVMTGATIGAVERVDRDGSIVVPLDADALRGDLEALAASEVRPKAVAVCLLWSFREDKHERMVRELVRETLGDDVFIVLSSAVAPVVGEYERTVTAALTAYIGPVVVKYLEEFRLRLQNTGFRGRLLLLQAHGGLTGLTMAVAQPLGFLDSGPVAGALGARSLVRDLPGQEAIFCDMGGTSFDVGIIHEGDLSLNEQPVIDRYTYAVPKVDVSSVGAGGGSIVSVDEYGMFHVGPESAGSIPGPACYGRGGTAATTTDVNLALGLLGETSFLGGKRRLDRARAIAALEKVAGEASTDWLTIATGAFRVVNAQMADLIRMKMAERGMDATKFTLVTFGGAGPTHGAFLAEELGIRRVVVPAQGSVFCSLGMLTTDIVHAAQRSLGCRVTGANENTGLMRSALAGLEAEVREEFEQDGVDISGLTMSSWVYMKYGLQVYEVRVPCPAGELDEGRLIAGFEEQYEATYGEGTGYRGAGIEVTRCRVEGRVPTGIDLGQTDGAIQHEATPPERSRDVTLPVKGGGSGTVSFGLYSELDCEPGTRLQTPAIIERYGDTVVVPAGAECVVDTDRNLVITL